MTGSMWVILALGAIIIATAATRYIIGVINHRRKRQQP